MFMFILSYVKSVAAIKYSYQIWIWILHFPLENKYRWSSWSLCRLRFEYFMFACRRWECTSTGWAILRPTEFRLPTRSVSSSLCIYDTRRPAILLCQAIGELFFNLLAVRYALFALWTLNMLISIEIPGTKYVLLIIIL